MSLWCTACVAIKLSVIVVLNVLTNTKYSHTFRLTYTYTYKFDRTKETTTKETLDAERMAMAVAKCVFSFCSSIRQIRVAGIEAARCSIMFNAAVVFKLPMNIHNPTWNTKRHAVADNALGDLRLRKKYQHTESARRGCKRATMTRRFITDNTCIFRYAEILMCPGKCVNVLYVYVRVRGRVREPCVQINGSKIPSFCAQQLFRLPQFQNNWKIANEANESQCL